MKDRKAGVSMAFFIWSVVGAAFMILGIYVYFSQKGKAFGFWTNAKMFEVHNVKGYNHALGKLYVMFGLVFIFLGLPLRAGQNSPYVVITILGCMLEAIMAMVIYVVVIEKKYRK